MTPADTSSGVKIALADAIQKRHNNITALEMPYNAGDAAIGELVQAVESTEIIVVGTISADRDSGQEKLVKALQKLGKPLIVVALRTPYDIRVFPMVETCLCTYGIRAVTTEAVTRVLFGEIAATGVLPCAIPGIG